MAMPRRPQTFSAGRAARRHADESLLRHRPDADAVTTVEGSVTEAAAVARGGARRVEQHPGVEARRRVEPHGVIEARAQAHAPHEAVRASGGAEEPAVGGV